MGGELVRQPADLPSARLIGLTSPRKRAHAAAADATGGEMAVDDGVDLVGALRRLVHALREAGHHTRINAEKIEEARNVVAIKAGDTRRGADIGRDLPGARQRIFETGRV